MDPVTYRNANGDERVVSSVDGAVAANAEGFYSPDSPSGRRLASLKAAETRAANEAKAAAKAKAAEPKAAEPKA